MIVPISLESDIEVTRRQLAKLQSVGAKRFHIDIIDGLFADNVTVAPADLQQLDLSNVEVDLHLLVDDPVEWIPECVALRPKRVIAQIEKMGSIEHFVEVMKEHKDIAVYLGIGIDTPIEEIDKQIMDKIDGVLLMAVIPGFGGSPFQSKVIDKIRELRSIYEVEIFIDGGINPVTYKQVLGAGASSAGANSYLWTGDFEKNWQEINKVE